MKRTFNPTQFSKTIEHHFFIKILGIADFYKVKVFVKLHTNEDRRFMNLVSEIIKDFSYCVKSNKIRYNLGLWYVDNNKENILIGVMFASQEREVSTAFCNVEEILIDHKYDDHNHTAQLLRFLTEKFKINIQLNKLKRQNSGIFVFRPAGYSVKLPSFLECAKNEIFIDDATIRCNDRLEITVLDLEQSLASMKVDPHQLFVIENDSCVESSRTLYEMSRVQSSYAVSSNTLPDVQNGASVNSLLQSSSNNIQKSVFFSKCATSIFYGVAIAVGFEMARYCMGKAECTIFSKPNV